MCSWEQYVAMGIGKVFSNSHASLLLRTLRHPASKQATGLLCLQHLTTSTGKSTDRMERGCRQRGKGEVMKQGWHLLQKVVLSLECTLSSSILSLPDFSLPFKCLISQIFCAITVLYTCTSICTHMYDLPPFCLGHPSEVGRQIKILL